MTADQTVNTPDSGSPIIGSTYPTPFRPAMRYSSFKLDEGYSEDTRSQSDNDTVMRTDSRFGDVSEQDDRTALNNWMVSLNGAERSEYIYTLLRTLPTSEIAAIVERLNPLLHLDPVAHLPPEITYEIFSYLSPETLLKTTLLSKSWRGRGLDSQLWRLLFRLEGWTANIPRVKAFEEEERGRRASLKERKARVRRADAHSEQHASKKRVYEGDGQEDRPAPARIDTSGTTPEWGEQHGVLEADEGHASGLEDRMQDIAFHSPPNPAGSSRPNLDAARFVRADGHFDSSLAFLDNKVMNSAPSFPLDPPAQPSLLLPGDSPRINWHYLYKQKRRLERNWSAGRYVNFSLPHPNHPDEAHTECVYTLQYSGNYLVSGSRDRSVRIWDLDTQRLVLPPLLGHSASVLCLQFDPRPEQDIVISGGSDCHVLLWRFSTGKLIKKLEKAHGESVLNLRFDDNYLITCSKDKTIKIWNRREILPTDSSYPKNTNSGARFPQYIINMENIADIKPLHLKPLRDYSLLMTLDGHTAAVNAIQIYEGQVVSASGDRTVKIWDVRNGACLKTLTGHTKGIACVQFDGRRIVSGSSDETVRIFDRATAAEVACLQGHTNLVRTVQASFGDLPGNEEELEAEARAIDRKFFEAREKGMLDPKLSRERRRARNAGSRDPRDIFAYGAKLPPGGGGSRWGRIVSGSYDESVIIWKKDPNTGRWVVGRVLLQNEAVRAAGVQRPRRPGQAPATAAAAAAQQQAQAHVQQAQQQVNAAAAQIQTQAAAPAPAPVPTAGNTQTGSTAHLQNMQASIQNLATQAHQQIQQAHMLAQQAQILHQQTQQAHNVQQAAQALQQHVAANPGLTAQQQQQHLQQVTQQLQQQAQQQPAAQQPQQPQQQAQQPNQPNQPQAQQGQGQPHHHHHHGAAAGGPGHHHHHHPLPGIAATQQGGGSRVFKLQFDSRRIICCSQDPTIVGWDFAAGDRDIMEASRFFGEE